jgi:isopenicillin-N N-acyltransferase like protein
VRVLELPRDGSPRTWGQIHGESYRGEIRSLVAIRTYLTCKVGGFPNEASVLACAEEHLPILERYDAALYQELCGIADGAGLSPAQVVVVNHYTDLRDLDPDPARREPARSVPVGDVDGGCSVIWSQTADGTVLAQTWDMHATAIPYVMMLRIPESDAGPEAWLLTLTGCLGMAGVNRQGLAIAINNLYSTDARVGIVWPAMVRKVLQLGDAAAGRDLVLSSPVGSGHHYLVCDERAAYGLETSGVHRKVIFSHVNGDGPPPPTYVHTNHCLDPAIAGVSKVPPTSTTFERYAWLTDSVAAVPPRDVADVWQRLGSEEGFPKSVCTNMSTPENPHGTATCGAIAVQLERREVWAAPGLIHNVRPERFVLRSEIA